MMKGFPNYLAALALMAMACSIATAYDPAPLQDFCVAANSSTHAGIYTFLILLLCSFQLMIDWVVFSQLP